MSEDVCETLRLTLTNRPGERYLNGLSGQTARSRALELARRSGTVEPGTIVALLGSGADGPRALRVSGEFGIALDGANRLALPGSGEAPHERTDGDLLWRPIPLTGLAAPADVEHVVRGVGIVTAGGEYGKRDTESALLFHEGMKAARRLAFDLGFGVPGRQPVAATEAATLWDAEALTGSGYKGWGPGNDALKRYEAESAQEALTLLEEFEAQDVRFSRDFANADCPACDGTGHSRLAAELLAAFTAGGAPESRWDGWGDRLSSEESEELDRVLRQDYGMPPSAATVRSRALAAAPLKAVELGAPETCPECRGSGHVRLSPDRLQAAVWVADARAGISFGIDVPDVSAAEAPELFAALARHGARKTGMAEIATFEDVEATEIAGAPEGRGWSAQAEFEDIPEFLAEFEGLDADLNLVQAVMRQPGSSPADGLTVSLAHPRKGGLRRCRIASADCGEPDWRRFTAMLGEAARIHERHFEGVRAAASD